MAATEAWQLSLVQVGNADRLDAIFVAIGGGGLIAGGLQRVPAALPRLCWACKLVALSQHLCACRFLHAPNATSLLLLKLKPVTCVLYIFLAGTVHLLLMS